MKTLILLFAYAFSLNSFAAPVDGEIYYKLPSGELTTRQVILDVPSRGQGEVVLSGTNFEWRTKKFKSFNQNGQTIFIAAFNTSFQSFKSTIIIKGTYLKGTNQIKFYGDVYKRSGHLPLADSLEQNLSGIDYIGGFSFDYLR